MITARERRLSSFNKEKNNAEMYIHLRIHISAFCSQNWEKVAREFQADPLEIDNMRKAFEQLDF